MSAPAYAVFDTPIGHCAIVWRGAAIAGVQLPEASAAATARRVGQRFTGVVRELPPPFVLRAIAAIGQLLRGGGDELAAIELDYAGQGPFHRRVYELARAIPAGATLTYGELAARAGEPGAARAVGQAMARNPYPLIVPCHRVLAAHGGAGGFSARGGVATKFRLLRIEGAVRQQALALG
ncbi:MAG: methylated-DNA--[protein]-cysteine S-methyltransferase [Gammaproteobacteria bacterium]|nr:methylated-DNA--[protein]-cysteine S-methyltransferase [Gammaproteobacteria bacterium]MDE2249919.1 methylated-DNA--[protein]-cysteine S-methyltransferase [Gammaproteobacteria bacterium]